MVAPTSRQERLLQLLKSIPSHQALDTLPDSATLLSQMSGHYQELATAASRRRAIQRDLESLVADGRIEVANAGSKPLRYRRLRSLDLESDPYVLSFARQTILATIRSALPMRRLDRLWQTLLHVEHDFSLDEDRLRIIPDNLRLLPADIRDGVLADAVEALARQRTLRAGYRDAKGKVSHPELHPQGLLQRGPLLYLYALKNDESEPVRMYALHRFTRTQVGATTARMAPGFSLQSAIDRGAADFAGAERITLELRARNYVADLLRDCPLADDQQIVDEPEGSAWDVRVRAELVSSGQLLRWLLGCGSNIEVLAPAALRATVAEQARRMAGCYD